MFTYQTGRSGSKMAPLSLGCDLKMQIQTAFLYILSSENDPAAIWGTYLTVGNVGMHLHFSFRPTAPPEQARLPRRANQDE